MANRIQTFLQGIMGIEEKKEVKKPKEPLVPFATSTMGSGMDTLTAEYLEEYRGWIYAAIQKIAPSVASIPLKLYKQTSEEGEVEEVKSHKAIDTLEQANPFLTYYDLVETTLTLLELTGNAYWWLIKNGNEVIEIYPWLRPDRMKVVPSAESFIQGYQYLEPNSGSYTPFETDEIIHFKYLNPSDPYYGIPPLKAAQMAVATDTKSQWWNYRFFKNSAIPNTVLELEESITDDQAERIRTQWENMHGEGREHRLAIISNGKLHAFGGSQKDMDFLEMRKFTRDEILAIYQVPKAIVDPQEVNRASAQVAQNVFLEQVIVPKMQKFVNILNEFYLPHFGDDRLFFGFEAPTTTPEDTKLKYYETLSKVGAITPNEIRQEEGFEPIEGGDEMFMQTQTGVQSVGTAERAYRKSKPLVPRRRHSKVADAIKDLEKKLKDNKVLAKKKRIIKRTKRAVDIKQEYQRKVLKRTAKQEREMEKLLIPEFERQQEEVLKSLTKKDYKIDFDVEEEAKIFKEIFTPFVIATLTENGEDALALIGFSGFDFDRAMQRYVRSKGLAFVTDINETTKRRLQKTIADGIAEGEGITKIRDRIRGTFTNATDSRATAIARTEVQKSANFATTEAWKQSGVVKGREWLATLDDRTCDNCRTLNGKFQAGLDSKFPSNPDTDGLFGRVPEPPAHINCRCTLIPITRSKSEQAEHQKEQSEKLQQDLEVNIEKAKGAVEMFTEEANKELGEIKSFKAKLNKILEDEQEEVS